MEYYGGLSIEVTRTPGRLVITLVGEMDMATSHALTEAVADLGSDGDGRPMIVELQMGDLWYVDATGLKALTALRSKVQAVELVNPSGHQRSYVAPLDSRL